MQVNVTMVVLEQILSHFSHQEVVGYDMPLPFEPEWVCHCFDQQSPMQVMLLT